MSPRLRRTALPIIAVAAAFAYAWGIDAPLLESYYAAGARSMSLGWRNFFFGAFDPDGTITLDKLPGAFWPQALAVRLFGPRPWAVVLPQVVEGVLTVLVLHRAVRRLLGDGPALTAAAILVLSPVTVSLNRGNIPDTLLTLLLVLAASATSAAIVSGRTRSLLAAAAWVGLGFQAKMLQAWLVLPALALAFVVSAPGTLRRRLSQAALAGAAAGVVSLSWVIVVSLTPATSRPWVDGSPTNSIFEQVFVYNGLRRAGGWSPLSDLAQLGLGGGIFDSPRAGCSRLLTGSFGQAAGWLLPAAVLVFVLGLAARRRAPRTDPVRAALLLWGGWLLVFTGAFSATSTGWAYYTAVLVPALAAVTAAGVAVLHDRPARGWLECGIVALAVLVTLGEAMWLLSSDGVQVPGSIRPLLAGMALVSVGTLAASAARSDASLARAGVASAMVSMLLAPLVACASIVAHRLGPFDAPFQPRSVTESRRASMTRVPELAQPGRGGPRTPYLIATQPAGLSARFVFYGGHRVVPIGGFTGTLPEPTVASLAAMVQRRDFHLVLAVPSGDPRYAWIASRCARVRRYAKAELFSCRPSGATDPGKWSEPQVR